MENEAIAMSEKRPYSRRKSAFKISMIFVD
jgi:hypothetical protein